MFLSSVTLRRKSAPWGAHSASWTPEAQLKAAAVRTGGN